MNASLLANLNQIPNPVMPSILILSLVSLLIFAYQLKKTKQPSWFVFISYVILFFGWSSLLIRIGMDQSACPIHGLGQVFIFFGWGLILFYLIAGTSHRLSLLGLITAPFVAVLGILGLVLGIEEAGRRTTLWGDLHVGVAMLAYAAYALAAVSSVSFYIQNKHLKKRQFSGIFLQLPPVQLLYKSSVNLIGIGTVLLTASLIFVFFSDQSAPLLKLWLAWITWAGYLTLWISVKKWGMPPRKFAWTNLGLFVLALTVLFATR